MIIIEQNAIVMLSVCVKVEVKLLSRSVCFSGNRLTFLPPSIKNLRELQKLDVRDNKDLIQLPVNLCYLANLEVGYLTHSSLFA